MPNIIFNIWGLLKFDGNKKVCPQFNCFSIRFACRSTGHWLSDFICCTLHKLLLWWAAISRLLCWHGNALSRWGKSFILMSLRQIVYRFFSAFISLSGWHYCGKNCLIALPLPTVIESLLFNFRYWWTPSDFPLSQWHAILAGRFCVWLVV